MSMPISNVGVATRTFGEPGVSALVLNAGLVVQAVFGGQQRGVLAGDDPAHVPLVEGAVVGGVDTARAQVAGAAVAQAGPAVELGERGRSAGDGVTAVVAGERWGLPGGARGGRQASMRSGRRAKLRRGAELFASTTSRISSSASASSRGRTKVEATPRSRPSTRAVQSVYQLARPVASSNSHVFPRAPTLGSCGRARPEGKAGMTSCSGRPPQRRNRGPPSFRNGSSQGWLIAPWVRQALEHSADPAAPCGAVLVDVSPPPAAGELAEHSFGELVEFTVGGAHLCLGGAGEQQGAAHLTGQSHLEAEVELEACAHQSLCCTSPRSGMPSAPAHVLVPERFEALGVRDGGVQETVALFVDGGGLGHPLHDLLERFRLLGRGRSWMTERNVQGVRAGLDEAGTVGGILHGVHEDERLLLPQVEAGCTEQTGERARITGWRGACRGSGWRPSPRRRGHAWSLDC